MAEAYHAFCTMWYKVIDPEHDNDFGYRKSEKVLSKDLVRTQVLNLESNLLPCLPNQQGSCGHQSTDNFEMKHKNNNTIVLPVAETD